MKESKILAEHIAELALEKKGEDITLLEMDEITTACDYFVIITGLSEIQNRAIADHIEKSLREDGLHLKHKEGYENGKWILLDYLDVVVHIFKPDMRLYYNLESLWADAKKYLVRDEV